MPSAPTMDGSSSDQRTRYCGACGARVAGKFCSACGARAGSGGPRIDAPSHASPNAGTVYGAAGPSAITGPLPKKRKGLRVTAAAAVILVVVAASIIFALKGTAQRTSTVDAGAATTPAASASGPDHASMGETVHWDAFDISAKFVSGYGAGDDVYFQLSANQDSVQCPTVADFYILKPSTGERLNFQKTLDGSCDLLNKGEKGFAEFRLDETQYLLPGGGPYQIVYAPGQGSPAIIWS